MNTDSTFLSRRSFLGGAALAGAGLAAFGLAGCSGTAQDGQSAENGKGAYLKARSREIYDMLVKRFKLDAPKKKARVQKDDVEDEEE